MNIHWTVNVLFEKIQFLFNFIIITIISSLACQHHVTLIFAENDFLIAHKTVNFAQIISYY